MAKKSKTPTPEELPLEEVAEVAPVEEVAPAKKATKPAKVALPDFNDESILLADFINDSFKAMVNRPATDLELAHFTKSVEVHKFPREDLHMEIRKGGEYQALKGL